MGKQFQSLKDFELPKKFRGRNQFVTQLWWIIQSTFFGCSPQFMYGWRVWLLRLFGAKIGDGVIIRPTARVTFPWKITIGNNTWIGDDVDIYSLGEINIGSNVVISQKSYICSAQHDMHVKTFDMVVKPIIIDDEAWIATDVFIAPGVSIGKGVVVGARSSVFKSLPHGVVAYGSPAKVITTR
jgi:putative colanic acid biosynthesis acetyltransferase WcaF